MNLRINIIIIEIVRQLDCRGSIIQKDLHTEGPGRPVEYKPEWDLKALMLRQLLQIPYMKEHLRFERVQEFHTDDMLKRAIQNMKKAKEP